MVVGNVFQAAEPSKTPEVLLYNVQSIGVESFGTSGLIDAYACSLRVGFKPFIHNGDDGDDGHDLTQVSNEVAPAMGGDHIHHESSLPLLNHTGERCRLPLSISMTRSHLC